MPQYLIVCRENRICPVCKGSGCPHHKGDLVVYGRGYYSDKEWALAEIQKIASIREPELVTLKESIFL